MQQSMLGCVGGCVGLGPLTAHSNVLCLGLQGPLETLLLSGNVGHLCLHHLQLLLHVKHGLMQLHHQIGIQYLMGEREGEGGRGREREGEGGKAREERRREREGNYYTL